MGDLMVELFGVKINCKGDLYGRITFGNLNDPQNLFNRKSTNSQSISMVGDDNVLSLTGPRDSICAGDEVLIDVDLTHRDSPEPTEDRINWQIGLGRNYQPGVLDNPLYMEIHGNNEKFATVFYAVFENAVKATVEVRLLPNGDKRKQSKIPVGFYGLLAASNDMIIGDDYESLLFRIRENSGQIVEVTPREPIPLSRPFMAVPLKSNLVVRADLFIKDGENFRAKLSFPAKPSGTSEKYIEGEYGRIQVKVIWSYY